MATSREPSLGAPVHVARDKFGIAHIQAETIADAAFVQGYVMAHDRLAQMDILRRFGAGTLAELFGALDASVIDTDLSMRVHRMTFYAQQTWDMLQASSDPTDQQIVQPAPALRRRRQRVRRRSPGAASSRSTRRSSSASIRSGSRRGRRSTRSCSAASRRSRCRGRRRSRSISPSSTRICRDTYDNAPPTDAAKHARAGISRDIMTVAPVGTSPTIDGFPNVDTDTGSRSDGGRAGHFSKHARRTRRARPEGAVRERAPVPATNIHDGAHGALGPHAFMRPWSGSNNWAVAPRSRTARRCSRPISTCSCRTRRSSIRCT